MALGWVTVIATTPACTGFFLALERFFGLAGAGWGFCLGMTSFMYQMGPQS
jgi:hypothetical protein